MNTGTKTFHKADEWPISQTTSAHSVRSRRRPLLNGKPEANKGPGHNQETVFRVGGGLGRTLKGLSVSSPKAAKNIIRGEKEKPTCFLDRMGGPVLPKRLDNLEGGHRGPMRPLLGDIIPKREAILTYEGQGDEGLP